MLDHAMVVAPEAYRRFPSQKLPEHQTTEQDDHHRDSRFERALQPLRYFQPQHQHRKAGDKQGERVPDSPPESGQRRSPRSAILSHDDAYRNQMIGVESMLQTKEKAEAEKGEPSVGRSGCSLLCEDDRRQE